MSKENFSNQLPAWGHYLREFGAFGIIAALFVFFIVRLEPIMQEQNYLAARNLEKLDRLERVLERLELSSKTK